MGKKQAKTYQGREGSDIDDADMGDAPVGDEMEEQSTDDKLTGLLESLAEKKRNVQLRSMQDMEDELKTRPNLEWVAARRDTIILYLTNVARKGSTEEAVAACNLLAVAIVTLGTEGGNTYRDLFPKLEKLVKDGGRSGAVRAAAVRVLSLACFVGSDEADEAMQLRDVLVDLWKQGVREKTEVGGPILTSQALASFGLIGTTTPSKTLANEYMQKYYPTLLELLDHQSLDVKASAAEVLALLFHAYQTDEAREGPVNEDALVEAITELANSSTRHIAKKDRAKQKSTFREILKSVAEGEEPEQTLTVGKSKHVFTGWRKVLVLEELRAVLGSGLPTHLARNELLRQIFNLQFASADEEPTKAARAVDRRANERSASDAVGKGRAKKRAMMGLDDE